MNIVSTNVTGLDGLNDGASCEAASVSRAVAKTAANRCVEVSGVTMVYPGNATASLDNVSIDIQENEFFTLLGPSGCGKTTLLRLIAGFEQPSAGEILLDGQSLVGRLPFQRPVNTVFQSYTLFPHLTVAQNIAFGLEMQRQPRAKITQTVREMLDLVKLGEFGARKPHQLSGGQQQRVALARALANRPRVLLLDESLSALDLKLRKEMQVELKRLQRETGITFLFVTHDQEEALTMSDRIAVMHGGRVQQIGTPTDIYDRPLNRFVADFIGDTNFLEAQAGRGGEIALAGGQRVALNGDAPAAGTLTLAVRPEHMWLAEQNRGATADVISLAGCIDNIVYMGTDTLYHVVCERQPLLRVRAQNRPGAQLSFTIGAQVDVCIPQDALRVMQA